MHWDHISKPARVKSAGLTRQRLAEVGKDLPLIVSGDLNAPEETREIIELTGANDSGRQLIDTYRKLHPARSKDESTFNHWQGTKEGSRIDFIFTTADFEPIEAEIVRTAYDNLYPSDHYPVTAKLKLGSNSQQ
jgi:endonuclease/exonuclease/phosphatase family metal-dependent hydrolase